MLQDNLQTKYTGGTVLHLFLGEQIGDVDTVKSLIRKVANNYHLPYFTLTPTFSVCPSHGYLAGEQTRCAQCNRETEVYSRVVGYLRPVKQWNDGKQAEYCRRRTFNLPAEEAEILPPAATEVAPVAAEVVECASEKNRLGEADARLRPTGSV
jgi:ribonucleoside-triphosphate reductase